MVFGLTLLLTFTVPWQKAQQGDCGSDLYTPPTVMRDVLVYGTRRGSSSEILLQTLDVRGKEGTRFTFTPVLPDHPNDQWSIRLVAVDMMGHASCPSPVFSINNVLSVEPVPQQKVEWFDIAGRKYREEPKVPGVYIKRVGTTKKLTIILK